MAVRGRCAVVDVAGSRRCGSTTCDMARYTGRIEVRSMPSVTERGGDCWYSPCMWMVPRRCSFVGQPEPAFVRRPGPTFVWRWGCRACWGGRLSSPFMCAEVGAHRRHSCMLVWGPCRHSSVGQPGPAFVCHPGPMFVWRRGYRACVLRWALVVTICACWGGPCSPFVSGGVGPMSPCAFCPNGLVRWRWVVVGAIER